MKLKNYLSLILSILLIACLLTGCGAAVKYETAAAEAEPMEAAAYDMEMGANGAALTSGSTAASTTLPESRKWIITVYMSAETDDLDAMTKNLDRHIQALDGYVEDQNVYNGSTRSNRRYRNASMTIRIPAEQVDNFVTEVEAFANVISKEKNLEDVTLNYVATESRVQALETEQERLLELLSQADNMTDLLEIEARLTDVRYELENYASQLRLYDNQIDYATIHLDISEVQEYTPVEEPTLWERISGGFTDSLKGLGESLQNLLVWFVVSLPFLAVYGGIAVAVILVIRRLRKNRKAKKVPPAPPAE